MENRIKNISLQFCILFWSFGFLVFLLLFIFVKIPVYNTSQGKIMSDGSITAVVLEQQNQAYDKIYYYINRDEWVDTSMIYNPKLNGYEINNKYGLSDETIVNVDFQIDTISLLKAIFVYGGNV